MILKKYLLLAGFSVIAAQSVLGQESQPATPPSTTTGTPATGAPAAGAPQWSNRDMTYRGKNYDVLDSSYYPKRRLKQYRQYMDHQGFFPPKPRNQWEVGIGFGQYNVLGDIASLNMFQKGGYGLNLHVRKAWGYVFSTRFDYTYGIGKNLDLTPTQSFDAPYTLPAAGGAYVPLQYAGPGKPATNIYRATRTESSQYNLDLMFNLYNINFHQARNSISFYGYLGLGMLKYKTRVNALDGNYSAYDFASIVKDPSASPRTIRKELQSKMDNTYESDADGSKGKRTDFAPSIGAGIQYKLNKQWNLQLEERYTFPGDDYLDGTRFGAPISGAASISQTKDAISYFSVGANYNIKLKKKAVEPLYWINPLDHIYSELSYPRHMILPNPVLPDEDADGVTDQFDKCPKTPAGVAVDGHGCPLDTDGDGVPDYKDKQLITPTECQPVDADGVGHCPCPEGCKDDIRNKKDKCDRINDGVIRFSGKGTITPAIEAQLAKLASEMRMNADCKVTVVGGGGSKIKEQRSWEHVNAVIEYMTEKQSILRARFIFQYGKGDDENVVNFHAAGEDEKGPDQVAPPHPELK